MSSTYGENLKLTIFGQSHGLAIGMTMDGIPAGLPVDLEKLHRCALRAVCVNNGWKKWESASVPISASSQAITTSISMI